MRETLSRSLECSIHLQQRELLIYGAGNTSSLYEKCFQREGLQPKYFIDKDVKKQHTLFQNVPVISPDEIAELCENPVVLICSARIKIRSQIQNTLNQMKLENYILDEIVLKQHREDILEIYDSLQDEYSKRTYATMILVRMGMDSEMELGGVRNVLSPNPYFGIPEFTTTESAEITEVFVDCGAYVGDTIEQYISMRSGVFAKIYAFEPIPANYKAMENRVARLKSEWALGDDKIVLVKAGLSDKEEELFIHPSETGHPSLGAMCSSEISDNKIEMISLDRYFEQIPIGFIKADIESFEEDMIRGGENVIRKYHPRLAICIYHNASDMFRIPKLIKAIQPDYKFAIRQHQFSMAETILYAY